jgi:hypothetical protein
MDEMLGSSKPQPVLRDDRLASGVTPLGQGPKRATRGDRGEEPVGDPELALDDERHDVMRQMTRVRSKMRTDDAGLAGLAIHGGKSLR